MESQGSVFFLSENEIIIRTYQCTKLRRLFKKPTNGYLTITNKRIVYHCIGNNISGSILFYQKCQSKMLLELAPQ
jgi:hypothetical protein